MSVTEPTDGAFHLDKRINVALVVTLVLQTGGIVWWAATLSAAQEQAVLDAQRMNQRIERIEAQRDDLTARVIRIEEKLSGQTETLREILRSVQRPDQAPGRP